MLKGECFFCFKNVCVGVSRFKGGNLNCIIDVLLVGVMKDIYILYMIELIIYYCFVCNFLKMNYKFFCNVYIRVCVGFIKSYFYRR